MHKKIQLIRTYISVGIGGPIPPLELLYVASQIEKHFGNDYQVRITDSGIEAPDGENLLENISSYQPDVIFLYAMAWEAGFVHTIAALVKGWNKNVTIAVFGQLATLAKDYICEDNNIDFVIIGEPELTVVELLGALEDHADCRNVNGLVYKAEGAIVSTEKRIFPEDLDTISITSKAWDLINVREYSKFANWNGTLKEKFYIPILTSRGCPFPCTFCLENYEKPFRARSPQNVIDEIRFLRDKYNVKEIHIVDAIFNYNNDRALDICQAIIDSRVDISLAFPHGVRADIMTEELIMKMKEAGTYKLVYGIETGSTRLQKVIKKNLNLDQVHDIIHRTAQTGIITGGYFMMGFPTETKEEMDQTLNFAVNSDLDVASFFKATDYNDVLKIYQSKMNKNGSQGGSPIDFADIGYFSVKRSQAEMPAAKLNAVILKAQRKFYLNARRIWRGLRRYPNKAAYIKNVFTAMGLILQAYLMQKLTADENSGQPAVKLDAKKSYSNV